VIVSRSLLAARDDFLNEENACRVGVEREKKSRVESVVQI
jgi:hypothetical protein